MTQNALWWILAVASYLGFPSAAVFLLRRWGRWALIAALVSWIAVLAAYGRVLGFPELAAMLIGLPLSGAALQVYALSRAWPVAFDASVAVWRSTAVALILVPLALVLGMVWALSACHDGGCL